jgi:hypothetical protein
MLFPHENKGFYLNEVKKTWKLCVVFVKIVCSGFNTLLIRLLKPIKWSENPSKKKLD